MRRRHGEPGEERLGGRVHVRERRHERQRARRTRGARFRSRTSTSLRWRIVVHHRFGTECLARLGRSLRNPLGPVYLEGGVVKRASVFRRDATPAFHSVFLTTDKRLVDGYDGTVLASDVDPLGQMIFAAGVWRARWRRPTARARISRTAPSIRRRLPATPDGYSYFLGGTASNGATGRTLRTTTVPGGP